MLLKLNDVTLGWKRDEPLLRSVSLSVASGESIAIMGPSGAGKTTLLNAAAGIGPVHAGTVRFEGDDFSGLRRSRRAAIRLRRMGLIFQFAELLPELSAWENVALPSRYLGLPRAQAKSAAVSALDSLGLAELLDRSPADLSGGQMQRVGIARALAHGPSLVLADEPTGMLDEHTSREVSELLFATAASLGTGLIVVTHDPAVAGRADRCLFLRDGALVAA